MCPNVARARRLMACRHDTCHTDAADAGPVPRRPGGPALNAAGPPASAGAADSGAWPAHHRIGSFEIVAVLRSGDSGLLYRAWDHALAQPVLLEEFLPPALAQRDAQGQMRPSLPAAAAVLERAGRLFVDEARCWRAASTRAWRACCSCWKPTARPTA